MAERTVEAARRLREAAKTLLLQRAANQGIRDWLPDAVIVVLTEDAVGATFEHLAERHPDGGHLARIVDGNRIEIVEVRRCDHRAERVQAAEETPIHPDAEIGMLFDYLRAFPGKRLHCIPTRPEFEVVMSEDVAV